MAYFRLFLIGLTPVGQTPLPLLALPIAAVAPPAEGLLELYRGRNAPAISDLRMQDMDGIVATEAICQSVPAN